MIIKVLYEDNIKNGHKNYVELEIPDDGNYTVMLDIDYEQRLAEAKPEKRNDIKRCNTIQEMFDIMNDKEFKNWRKHYRHIGDFEGQEYSDDGFDDVDEYCGTWQEPTMSNVADSDIFRRQELQNEKQKNYEETCAKVRTILKRSPQIAEAFIAVRLDGMDVQDYAASIGVSDPDLVSKWLERAEKRMKKFFQKCQI